eukprot:GHUV01011027.1.p1 GENE.GHUV01011027.1~~GHUV01011027.1.p1  ORF type:complete len:367 (+),score=82.44 GHUV01011027.1:462-1562(+)
MTFCCVCSCSAATKEDMAAHHALFINTLKGHTDTINSIAWSPNGRLLASACDDMQLRLFDMSDLSNQNLKFKKVKLKQGPVGVGFGNDGSSLVAALRGYPGLQLIHFVPHKKGPNITWEQDWNKQGILGHETLLDMTVIPAPQSEALGYNHAGGVAVLLSEKKEGRVYGLAAGGEMGEFHPNSFANHALAVSPNGRFIAVASFTADVMIWEVQWGRDGYKGLSRVMDLKGHSSQVMSVAFNADGSRTITASKDGTLRIWNTAVRYHLQEDPKQLLKVDLPKGQVFERMAWGPDGTIAAAIGGQIHFIDSKTGKTLEVLHAHESHITCMCWCPQFLQLTGNAPIAVLASSSTDRRLRIWKSPVVQEE